MVQPATGWPALRERLIVALAGAREPIVIILLLIAFFTSISGKPLDGLLLLIVAVGLGWDAAVRYRARTASGTCVTGPAAAAGCSAPPAPVHGDPRAIAAAGGSPAPGGTACPTGPPRRVVPGAAGTAGGSGAAAADDEVWSLRPVRQPLGGLEAASCRLPLGLAGLLAAAAYAVIVGSFTRYSWPATVGVTAIGAVVVGVGWHGPVRQRAEPGRLALPGAALWGVLLVAGGVWELVSLLQQPDLTTTSFAHPTISALTDPLLVSHAGRSVALAMWLGLGWLLAER